MRGAPPTFFAGCLLALTIGGCTFDDRRLGDVCEIDRDCPLGTRCERSLCQPFVPDETGDDAAPTPSKPPGLDGRTPQPDAAAALDCLPWPAGLMVAEPCPERTDCVAASDDIEVAGDAPQWIGCPTLRAAWDGGARRSALMRFPVPATPGVATSLYVFLVPGTAADGATFELVQLDAAWTEADIEAPPEEIRTIAPVVARDIQGPFTLRFDVGVALERARAAGASHVAFALRPAADSPAIRLIIASRDAPATDAHPRLEVSR